MDRSTVFIILRFCIDAALTLLLALMVLGVKIPAGPEYRKARVVKYALFLSYLILGFPLVYRTTPLSMFFRFLVEGLSYMMILTVPLFIIARECSFKVKGYFWAAGGFVLSFQSSFFFWFPMYGMTCVICKWLFFSISLLLAVYLAVSVISGIVKYSDNRSVRNFGMYYFCVLIVTVFNHLILPMSKSFDKAVAFVNVFFVLTSAMLIASLYDYMSKLRLKTDLSPASDDSQPVRNEPEQLSEETIARLKSNLDKWVEERRYLEQDEGVENVASELGTDIKTLRAYFRMKMPSDFRTWRISLRIKYAKDVLKENPEISMNRLSEMAGFATGSNFYYYFKKNTGLTPSQYKENMSSLSN